jgi:hypothetical protein
MILLIGFMIFTCLCSCSRAILLRSCLSTSSSSLKTLSIICIVTLSFTCSTYWNKIPFVRGPLSDLSCALASLMIIILMTIIMIRMVMIMMIIMMVIIIVMIMMMITILVTMMTLIILTSSSHSPLFSHYSGRLFGLYPERDW